MRPDRKRNASETQPKPARTSMEHLLTQLAAILPTALTGSVVRTEGAASAVAGFPAPLGALVEIARSSGPPVRAEVIGFRDELTLVSPLGDLSGVRYGNRVRLVRTARCVPVGDALRGRVIDAHGAMLDGRPAPRLPERAFVNRSAPPVFERPPITNPLDTGIRALDGLLPCGQGQRMGVFAGAGVGKSLLLGMLARNARADVNVIALIGERGREVKEFVENHLGPDGMAKSVVVVATSDDPPLLRLAAAATATTVAEFFRDQGHHVLLAMDSLTRFAMAQREIGLASGETPASRGYPPSVFATLPRLLERAGSNDRGSISAFYTVLVEGDDLSEPISDAARALLDGHLVLSRRLASAGLFPAVDVLESVSRLTRTVAANQHLQALNQVRQWLADYRKQEDAIAIGVYQPGTSPDLDAAIRARAAVDAYLRQDLDEACPASAARQQLLQLVQNVKQPRNQAA